MRALMNSVPLSTSRARSGKGSATRGRLRSYSSLMGKRLKRSFNLPYDRAIRSSLDALAVTSLIVIESSPDSEWLAVIVIYIFEDHLRPQAPIFLEVHPA